MPDRRGRSRILSGACWCLLILCVSGCVYLAQPEDAVVSQAQAPDPQSRIGQLLGGGRGVPARGLLVEASDLALTARIDMIDAADATIDAQYFIWQNDPTGVLVIQKLLDAADRGVRVRALLDDVQLTGFVDRLNALDDHPNIEIRIFNPFSVRFRYPLGFIRIAEFAIDGARLNHRMHNKLMVADNQLAILGGRNIGDDYFGRNPKRNFVDTDILLSGDIVPELSRGFDSYWNSRWAYPVSALMEFSLLPVDLETIRQRIRDRLEEWPDLESLGREIAFEDTLADLRDAAALDWSTTVVDDPEVGWFERPDDIALDLTELALRAEREVLVVTPYLIPTPNAFKIGKELVDKGVRVRIVTNSLGTNDVVAAQAAYGRYRRRILDTGVELYELRADAALPERGLSEEVCLHSKYIIIDDEIVFVGSLNLDPRSLYLNTEVGVVLESRPLAATLRESFDLLAHPDSSWRVTTHENGFRWESSAGTLDRQPAKNGWQRFRYWFLSLIPVSSQL
ncbi:MAG TPA: phospholipase D family protein [Pseudomonadales bacterium]